MWVIYGMVYRTLPPRSERYPASPPHLLVAAHTHGLSFQDFDTRKQILAAYLSLGCYKVSWKKKDCPTTVALCTRPPQWLGFPFLYLVHWDTTSRGKYHDARHKKGQHNGIMALTIPTHIGDRVSNRWMTISAEGVGRISRRVTTCSISCRLHPTHYLIRILLSVNTYSLTTSIFFHIILTWLSITLW